MPGSTDIDLAEGDAWGVVPFTPTGPSDAELEWFFTMAESDMGARSNFVAMVGKHDGSTAVTRAEAARARRTILEWLTKLRDPRAGVLQAAYEAKPWPLVLREPLGRVTRVVVRLVSAQGCLPDDQAERAAMDQQSADTLARAFARRGDSAFEPFRVRAVVLLRDAFVSYERVRGGPARAAIRGIS